METTKRKMATGIEQYISEFPPAVQVKLQAIRKAIHEAAPGAGEKISYAIPTIELNGNLVHFAAFRNHIGFYPGADGIAHFKKELSKFEGAKGSVQFPLDQPIPIALIKRITKYRVKQNLTRQVKKAKK